VVGDHEVVVADLADRAQGRLRALPRVLVVQHHRPAPQRLQLGYRIVGVEDLGGGEDPVVRIVAGQHQGQRVGPVQHLRHRRRDRRQLGGVVALVPEDLEQQREDLVLAAGVPRGRQAGVAVLDRGDLPVAVLPRREQRQEDVGAAARHVPPAGGPLVEHRQRVAVDPVQVLPQVAQQREPVRVRAGLDPGQDVGPGRGLRLEVAPDHGRELVEGVQHREVQRPEDRRGENESAVPVDHERLHPASHVDCRPGNRLVPVPHRRRPAPSAGRERPAVERDPDRCGGDTLRR
jgi:hypothetical protein